MKARTLLGVSIAIVALGFAAGAFWWNAQSPDAANAAAPATAQAVMREFSTAVTAIGAVKPQIGAEVRVGARISGKLMRLPANIGDRVERGQVIAELESADLAATVARHEAAVAVAREEIADAESRQKLSEATYQRQLSLLKISGTSQQLVDEALRESQSAAVGIQIAIRERELAEAQLREARVNLSYATITAPISGVIGSVTTQEGETVAAGLNAPTFVVIVDLDRLQVNAFVDEVDIGKVKLGQRVTFNVDAFPAQDFTGSGRRDLSERHDPGQRRQICRGHRDRRRGPRPLASRDDRERAHPARNAHRARDPGARDPAGRRPHRRACRERRGDRNPPDPHRLARWPLGRNRRRLERRRTHSVERDHTAGEQAK